MKRKTTYYFLQIVIITVLFLLVSCGGNRVVDSKMASADSLMDVCQDSAQTALAMLDSLKAQKPNMSKAQQMHYDLIYAKAMNKSFVDFTTDSVMKRVVAYYDKHGSVNERMLAYYLLGCVYRDLQDAPASLDNYYKAVELADTTSASCDYALLARIHGAMVVLYNKESSPLMSIKEAKLAAKYAWMAKDTLAAVVAYRNQVGGYYDLGNSDSVLSISLNAHHFCRKNGMVTEMYHGLNAIIDVYINRKDYKRADYYIQMMRQNSNSFITPNLVRRGNELLYYNIGRYYCGIARWMRVLAISVRYLRQTILHSTKKRRLIEDYILLISSRGFLIPYPSMPSCLSMPMILPIGIALWSPCIIYNPCMIISITSNEP